MQEFIAHIEKEAIRALSSIAFTGEIIVVSHPNESENAAEYLSTCPLLGFDTETKPSFHRGQKHRIALLQLSSENKAYLFRLHSTGISESLAKILGDKNILKVGAAIHDDIKGLMKIRRFQPDGFVDLQKIAPDYGIQDKSVRKMAAIVLNARISKAQRLTNWENSVLTHSQQLYAATDAWVCREIYAQLLKNSHL